MEAEVHVQRKALLTEEEAAQKTEMWQIWTSFSDLDLDLGSSQSHRLLMNDLNSIVFFNEDIVEENK